MAEGKTTIAPEVLRSIIRLAAINIDGVSKLINPPGNVNRIFQRSTAEGVEVEVLDDTVYADVFVIIKANENIREVSQNIQLEVARSISDIVCMKTGKINIHVEDIDYNIKEEVQSQ